METAVHDRCKYLCKNPKENNVPTFLCLHNDVQSQVWASNAQMASQVIIAKLWRLKWLIGKLYIQLFWGQFSWIWVTIDTAKKEYYTFEFELRILKVL